MKKLILGAFFLLAFVNISNATVYYSTSGSKNWNAANAWSTSATGSPGNYSATVTGQSANTFVIRSGTQMTLTLNQTVALVSVSGTFVRNSSSFAITGSVTVANGGTYKHGIDGGTIPSYTWNTGSTCNVTGINSATALSGLNQTFSNFTWNCSSQANLFDISGIGDITGTFSILSDAGLGLTIESATSKTITGSLSTNDIFYISNANNTDFYVKDVTVNSGGTIYISNDVNQGRLILSGSLLWNTGGYITAPNGGTGQVVFANSSSKTASFPDIGSQFNDGESMSLIVNSGSTLDISGSSADLSLESNHTMAINGTLVTGSRTITANGSGSSFTLANNATLSSASSGGVNSTILVSSGTTSFDNGASYILSGGGNLDLPNTIMKSLTININQVTAVSNLSITGGLVLSSSIDPTSYNIYVGGNLSGTGNIFYGTGTSAFIFNGTTTISGTGNRYFNNVSVTGSLTAPSSSINVNSDFINTGAFSHGNGTVNLTGTTSRTVSNASFYTLYAAGTGNNPAVTYSGTVGIANTWTPGTGTITQNGTFNFNGTGSQSINTVLYKNLQTAGSGTKTLSGNTTFTGNVTVGSGTTLYITGTDIELKGDLSVSGTLSQPSGTISLTGTNSQALSGTPTFGNLTLNKGAGDVTISSGTTSVSGFLTISSMGSSNKLNTNGNLVLTSNATSTGSLIDFSTAGSGGSVNGNVTVQRFSVGRASTGHYFSAPTANAPYTSLTNVITGYNILLYSENGVPARASASFAGSLRRVTNTGAPSYMTEGRGFSLRQPSDATVAFSGIPNNGDISIAVTYTATTGADAITMPASLAGWNLIGNPYPSAIRWSTVTKPTGMVANLFEDGAYHVITSADEYYIPSGQAFYVQASVTGTVTFHNSARIGSGTPNNTFYRLAASSDIQQYFHLDLIGSNGIKDVTETAIFSFNANASDELDGYDARKLPSVLTAYPNMYSVVDGNALSVNVLNPSSYDKTVPLYITSGLDGIFTLSGRDLSSFYSDQVDVFLLDANNTGTKINLREQPTFIFTKSGGDAYNRFSLIFSAKDTVPITDTTPVTIVTNVGISFLAAPGFREDEVAIEESVTGINIGEDVESLQIYSVNNKVILHGNSLLPIDIHIYDSMGNLYIQRSIRLADNKYLFELPKEGVYIVKAIYGNQLTFKKVLIN